LTAHFLALGMGQSLMARFHARPPNREASFFWLPVSRVWLERLAAN
jgi:hypothetical protein